MRRSRWIGLLLARLRKGMRDLTESDLIEGSVTTLALKRPPSLHNSHLFRTKYMF